MGRSVSVPFAATVVTYIDTSDMEDEWDWEDMKENIMETLINKMPSLIKSDGRWLGNEDKVLLENDLAFIGISEYMGITSLWVVPRDEYLALAHLWIYRIAHHVEQLGDLKKDGTMSNGVSVYTLKETK